MAEKNSRATARPGTAEDSAQFDAFLAKVMEPVAIDQHPPVWQVLGKSFEEFMEIPTPVRDLICERVQDVMDRLNFERGRRPRANWKTLAREARKPRSVVPQEWGVGLLTSELWKVMSPGPRQELTALVNQAVLAIARRYAPE
jgi:hypothetical protein